MILTSAEFQSSYWQISGTEIILLAAGVVFTLGVIAFLLFTFLRKQD